MPMHGRVAHPRSSGTPALCEVQITFSPFQRKSFVSKKNDMNALVKVLLTADCMWTLCGPTENSRIMMRKCSQNQTNCIVGLRFSLPGANSHFRLKRRLISSESEMLTLKQSKRIGFHPSENGVKPKSNK